jgi:hypothetical protein
LTQMYKREHEIIHLHLNQENKKISVWQLNIDASVKAPKKLSQVCWRLYYFCNIYHMLTL